jgi:hypothetical protein
MAKELPIMENSEYAALMQISISGTAVLNEEQEASLFVVHRLITRKNPCGKVWILTDEGKNPCGKVWILTDEGKKVVRAMLAVAKVLTHQDAYIGHIDLGL